MDECKDYKRKYACLRRFLFTRWFNPERFLNDQFRMLAEFCPDVVFVVDAGGWIIMVNHAATKVSGYSRDEILGQHFRMFLTLDDLSAGFKIFYRTLRGESTEATRLRIRRKDGSTTVLELSGTPIRIKGKFIGGLAIARDVSEQMRRQSQDRIREQTFIQLMADLESERRQVKTLKNELAQLKGHITPS
ncbi:MAG: PAS domain S-box protein [Candidatus Omnitrophica bacterium]|nr:PAS domain S-box protein [Candidatus Omnitrophota bacterium]